MQVICADTWEITSDQFILMEYLSFLVSKTVIIVCLTN